MHGRAKDGTFRVWLKHERTCGGPQTRSPWDHRNSPEYSWASQEERTGHPETPLLPHQCQHQEHCPRGPRNGVPGVPPGKMRVQGSPPLTLLPAVLQMLQRLCGRVQEEVRALRLCPLEPVQDELLYARDLIKDAKNSRAVSPPQPHPPSQSESPGRPATLPQEYPRPDPCICPPSPGLPGPGQA